LAEAALGLAIALMAVATLAGTTIVVPGTTIAALLGSAIASAFAAK